MIEQSPIQDALYNDQNMVEKAWLAIITDSRGAPYRMTGHDHELSTMIPKWDEMRPSAGVTSFAIRNETGLSPGTTELKGLISDDEDGGITLAKLIDGRFRGGIAEIICTTSRWPTFPPPSFLTPNPQVISGTGSGRFFEVYDIQGISYDENEWSFQLSDVRSRYNRKVGEIHARTCQNQLGLQYPSGRPDADTIIQSYCSVDVTTWPAIVRNSLIIDVPEPRRRFTLFNTSFTAGFTPTTFPGTTFSTFGDDYFTFGYVDFLDGGAPSGPSQLSGLRVAVEKSVSGPAQPGGEVFTQEITLALPTPFDITTADIAHITVGCDHQLDTCHFKFNNTPDMRADPYIPGMDNVVSTANTGASSGS